MLHDDLRCTTQRKCNVLHARRISISTNATRGEFVEPLAQVLQHYSLRYLYSCERFECGVAQGFQSPAAMGCACCRVGSTGLWSFSDTTGYMSGHCR